MQIHPFLDGNGRVARAMSTFVLMRWGYDFEEKFSQRNYHLLHREFFFNTYYRGDRKKYYRALGGKKRTKNIPVWIKYFTNEVKKDLKTTYKFLKSTRFKKSEV